MADIDYSKLSNNQLLAMKSGDFSKLSNDEVLGLHQARQGKQEASAPESPTQPDQSLASRAYDMYKSPRGLMGSMADNFKANMSRPAPTDQEIEQIKRTPPIEGSAPAAIPASVAPAALMALSKAIENSGKIRIGANTALGGLQGLLKTPQEGETRLSNAGWGAGEGLAASAGAEGAAKGAQLAGQGLRWVGGAAAGLKPGAANAYADNPELVAQMNKYAGNNKDLLEKDMQSQVQSARQKLYDAGAGDREKFAQLGVGKNIQVQPDQFEGTAAGQEIKRAFDTQGNTVPYTKVEPYNAQSTPVRPQINYGEADAQTPAYSANNGKLQYSNKNTDVWAPSPVDVHAPSTSIVQDGPVQDLRGFLNRGAAQEPAVMPGRVSLTMPQAEAARRSSDNAARLAQQNSPIVQIPADHPEYAAASRLRAARNNVLGPKGAEVAERVSDDANMSDRLANLGSNPARILTDSDAPGSTSTAALGDYLDRRIGTNFSDQAGAYQASRELNNPVSGLWANGARPVGKALLRGSSAPLSAGKAVEDNYSPLLQALLAAKNAQSQ